jgi:hypothetical protein
MISRGRNGDYDIEVELTLLTPEEGGRTKPLPSAFWFPHLLIDGSEWMAYFKLRDREILQPGETARVFVVFASPELLQGRIYPEKHFRLHEAYHPIGQGRILTMLNFEKHV